MTQEQFVLTQVIATPPLRLSLVFADGEHASVDLQPLVERVPALAALRNPALFGEAMLDTWGGAVIWEGHDMLELAADNLRAWAIEQAGGVSHQMLWNWMSKHQLTLDTAANALGLSRRMLAYYRSGEKPIPKTVGLALLGWECVQAKGGSVFPLHGALLPA